MTRQPVSATTSRPQSPPAATFGEAEHDGARRTDTVDRYLETIYYIDAEGEIVRPGRIAEWLGVSAPTVSVGLARLARDGWIDIASNRSVSLTPAGLSAAAGVVRRHRLLERWLTDVLGLDWATADAEAERLAPAVSDAVLERLDDLLEHPNTCPHGNLIPGRESPYGELVSLADLEPETSAWIRRISEVAEHEAPHLLRQLTEYGVRTGVEVVITGDTDGGALALRVGERTMALSTATARRIWVDTSGVAQPV
jgi:DtxR family transcriptional regulator, Mn-dependent transcriptional regulator